MLELLEKEKKVLLYPQISAIPFFSFYQNSVTSEKHSLQDSADSYCPHTLVQTEIDHFEYFLEKQTDGK